MLCPSCYTLNRDNAKFCKGCGQILATEVVAATDTPSSEYLLPLAQDNPASDSQNSIQSAQSSYPTEAPSDSSDNADPQLDPTQHLTLEQMQAYHSHRWQQGVEQGKHVQSMTHDVADLPTMAFTPGEYPDTPPRVMSGQQADTSAEDDDISDVAELPTMIMPPGSQSATDESADASPTSAEISSGSAEAATTNTTVPEGLSAATNAVSASETAATNDKEEYVEQTNNTSSTEENVNAFPALPVDTIVADRYKVVQVISSTPDEHIYEVGDLKGYLHCWNCDSEDNAEGDEFCINCGAELLNYNYTMHAYPASASSPSPQDALVLQGNIVNTLVDQGHTYVIEQPATTQQVFPTGVRLLAACDSDAGTLRRGDPNEDSTFILLFERVHESIATPSGIFVVADGMGGHDNGQGASRMTVAVIAERVTRELLMPPLHAEKTGADAVQLDEDAALELVHGAVEDANIALCQTNQHDKTDMGSTLTGFMIIGDHAYIFNVGDSRTYMLRDQKLYQVTNDHSLVGQLVAGGLIEPDDVYTHPQRSQIYRSIGDKLNVQIDLFKQQIHPGDILLSCSDGLWEMVRDPQITDILNSAQDPQTACAQLIEAANNNGGEDNVSAVAVFVH